MNLQQTCEQASEVRRSRRQRCGGRPSTERRSSEQRSPDHRCAGHTMIEFVLGMTLGSVIVVAGIATGAHLRSSWATALASLDAHRQAGEALHLLVAAAQSSNRDGIADRNASTDRAVFTYAPSALAHVGVPDAEMTAPLCAAQSDDTSAPVVPPGSTARSGARPNVAEWFVGVASGNSQTELFCRAGSDVRASPMVSGISALVVGFRSGASARKDGLRRGLPERGQALATFDLCVSAHAASLRTRVAIRSHESDR